MKIENKNIEIQNLRAFGAIAVLLVHCSAYYAYSSSDNFMFIDMLNVIIFNMFIFAVPLFNLISGYVLCEKYGEKINLKEFYIKRFVSIVPQYIFFSIIYIFLRFRIKTLPDIDFNIIFWNILRFSSFYHLWFFALIFQFYILFPLILYIYKRFLKNKYENKGIIIILFIQIFWEVFSNIIYKIFFKENNIFENQSYDIARKLILSHIFYFILGIYIYNNLEKIIKIIKKYNIFILICLYVLLISVVTMPIILGIKQGYEFSNIPKIFSIGEYILFPILFCTAFIILYKLSKYIKNKILLLIGELSFGIYLIHPFYNILFYRILSKNGIGIKNIIFYPTLFFITLILSLSTCYIIKKIPYLRFLIGIKS